MKSYLLKPADKLIPITKKKYRIKALDETKKSLNTVKSKLDDAYEKPAFAKYWSSFDPFKNEKAIVAKLGNTWNVSNAWLKCYEMLIYYDLLPAETEKFWHFDNASFPGSFVIATHHLVQTRYSWGSDYIWRASSLLGANQQTVSPLEDKYGLYNEYRNHYLMGQKNNGDVLVEANQREFHERIGGTIDLYTSDLGFDVSSDYNNQESLQMPANIGQILTGLLVTKKGGSFITKQYTIFEPMTIAVMYAASTFFEEFYVCKPYTSREANSETYLIGKRLKENVSMDHPYIVALFDKINDLENIAVPIFDAKDYPKEFLKTIVLAAKELSESQIEKLELDLGRAMDCIDGNAESIIADFHTDIEEELVNWYHDYPVRPIADDDRLVMKNALGQKS